VQRHRQRPSSPEASSKPGVIDTLGVAFASVNRRPYLIVLPVLVDLYLWLGVGVSAGPLTNALVGWLSHQPGVNASTVSTISDAGQHYDLVSLLVVSLPSLLGELGHATVAGSGPRLWVSGLPWWSIAALGAALVVVGVGIGMLYLTTVGYLIADRPASLQLCRDAIRNAIRMLGFAVLTFLTLLLLATPALLFGGILLALGVNVVPILALLAWFAVIWVFFLLFFAQDAIVVSEVGPMQAMFLSYNVVRRNAWTTAGFIAVYLVISTGTPLALRIFTQTPWAVPAAMLGNAYVSTGLVAASMLFYRDRVRQLMQGERSARG